MGILQARVLEWVAMPSSRGSSQPRDRTQVSSSAGKFFIILATRDSLPSKYTFGGMQTGSVTTENNVDVPQKVKNGTTT